MGNAVEFQDVAAKQGDSPVTFSIPAGSLSALVTSRQYENDLLASLLLGLTLPATGRISLSLGDEALRSDAVPSRAVAVVFPAGGLVSNLKVWENLVLPLEYHGMYPAAVIEEKGMAILKKVGYSGRLMELPAHLSQFEKKLIGLARAMLTEPRLIVYNSVLGGLSAGERDDILSHVLSFHREQKCITSLFLSTNPDSLHDIPLEHLIFMKESLV